MTPGSWRLWAWVWALSGTAVLAETTPMTERIPEESVATIACELTTAPSGKDVPFVDSAKDRKSLIGTYHYKVWLPKGYHAEAAKQWPSLFIASPGGNASMGPMADWLKANGYIVIMLVESKNETPTLNFGNFLAAHDDAVKRFRLKEGEKIATGFSGGARSASLFVQMRPGFRGLILQGAGVAQASTGEYLGDGVRRIRGMRVAMIMGETDANRREIPAMEAGFSGKDRFKAFLFTGGHSWAPAETFAQAANWVIGKP